MRRGSKLALAVALLAPVAIQFAPVERTNPPVEAELEAPPAVHALLRRACYDCHSHQTRWPWYSRVAPISWVVAADVRRGRAALNFSEWETLTAERRARLAEEMWEEVRDGGMPMPAYLFLHRSARLSDEDRAALRAWTAGFAAE